MLAEEPSAIETRVRERLGTDEPVAHVTATYSIPQAR